MILTRQALPSDATAINQLTYQLGYTISADQTLLNIQALAESQTHELFVATDGDKVIGWTSIFYCIQVESAPHCELHGLVVDIAYRGKGIGSLLIDTAKQWCREKNIHMLRLRCNTVRTETHRFYQKIGFKEIKEQKVFEIKL